jgi:hypothetical protein
MFNFSGLFEIFWRFSLNIAVIMVLVRWLYYTRTRKKNYLFTYILISSIVFLLCYLLENVTLQVGFALGLFAIFGIIRYRTNAISIKEMTYLFLIIGVSVINSLADVTINIAEILFSNAVIIAVTFGLEKVWLIRHIEEKTIVYDRLELIKPERYDELVNDIRERTGINKITRIGIGKIDFPRNQCNLKVYFDIPGIPDDETNSMENIQDDDD